MCIHTHAYDFTHMKSQVLCVSGLGLGFASNCEGYLMQTHAWAHVCTRIHGYIGRQVAGPAYTHTHTHTHHKHTHTTHRCMHACIHVHAYIHTHTHTHTHTSRRSCCRRSNSLVLPPPPPPPAPSIPPSDRRTHVHTSRGRCKGRQRWEAETTTERRQGGAATQPFTSLLATSVLEACWCRAAVRAWSPAPHFRWMSAVRIRA